MAEMEDGIAAVLGGVALIDLFGSLRRPPSSLARPGPRNPAKHRPSRVRFTFLPSLPGSFPCQRPSRPLRASPTSPTQAVSSGPSSSRRVAAGLAFDRGDGAVPSCAVPVLASVICQPELAIRPGLKTRLVLLRLRPFYRAFCCPLVALSLVVGRGRPMGSRRRHPPRWASTQRRRPDTCPHRATKLPCADIRFLSRGAGVPCSAVLSTACAGTRPRHSVAIRWLLSRVRARRGGFHRVDPRRGLRCASFQARGVARIANAASIAHLSMPLRGPFPRSALA